MRRTIAGNSRCARASTSPVALAAPPAPAPPAAPGAPPPPVVAGGREPRRSAHDLRSAVRPGPGGRRLRGRPLRALVGRRLHDDCRPRAAAATTRRDRGGRPRGDGVGGRRGVPPGRSRETPPGSGPVRRGWSCGVATGSDTSVPSHEPLSAISAAPVGGSTARFPERPAGGDRSGRAVAGRAGRPLDPCGPGAPAVVARRRGAGARGPVTRAGSRTGTAARGRSRGRPVMPAAPRRGPAGPGPRAPG